MAGITPYIPKNYVSVQSHGPILYWWPVWFYGGFCAAIKYPVDQHSIQPYAWLDVSYIGLLLATIAFTSFNVRGSVSYAVFFLIAAVSTAVYIVSGMWPFGAFPEISISAGFYLTFSIGLFAIWGLSIFVVDRLRSRVYISPGQITIVDAITGTVTAYDARAAAILKLPANFFLNHLIGMSWIGFGTGDVQIRFPNKQEVTLRNVWRPTRKMNEAMHVISRLDEATLRPE